MQLHTIDSIVRGFRSHVATIGLRNTCLYATSRVLHVLFRGRVRLIKYYFMSQPVMAPTRRSRTRGSSFKLAFADAHCELFRQVERPAEIIAARFAQGAQCLAATNDEMQLAGFLWFVIGPYDEDEVRARFEPRPTGRTAWDFDVTIMPRYRMSRLFGQLWERASAELAARGVRSSLSRISAFNAPSLASHRRLGARIVGEAVFVCAGPLQLLKSSLEPRWHLSWREEQRPVLAVDADAD